MTAGLDGPDTSTCIVPRATDRCGRLNALRRLLRPKQLLAQVTVYASGARVRRVTTVNGGAEGALSRVRIVGLPVSVIDDTVRVEVEGPAIATNVRVSVGAPATRDAAEEEAPALRAARAHALLAETEVERMTALSHGRGGGVVEEDFRPTRHHSPGSRSSRRGDGGDGECQSASKALRRNKPAAARNALADPSVRSKRSDRGSPVAARAPRSCTRCASTSISR